MIITHKTYSTTPLLQFSLHPNVVIYIHDDPLPHLINNVTFEVNDLVPNSVSTETRGEITELGIGSSIEETIVNRFFFKLAGQGEVSSAGRSECSCLTQVGW